MSGGVGKRVKDRKTVTGDKVLWSNRGERVTRTLHYRKRNGLLTSLSKKRELLGRATLDWSRKSSTKVYVRDLSPIV